MQGACSLSAKETWRLVTVCICVRMNVYPNVPGCFSFFQQSVCDCLIRRFSRTVLDIEILN